jgi:signal transduction histidine kinase
LKAVAAVKADKAKALDEFNKGEGGFRDRDLYVFCFNTSDGKNVANPNPAATIGTDVRTIKDSTGKPFGEELYAAAQNRKVKSLRSATCFRSRVQTRNRSRK